MKAKKTLYIIAGANGSGKTTFALSYVELNNLHFINAESGKYLINIIKEAKERGFIVVLIYLFLENDVENILRVRNRVLNGGHNVPDEDIKRRYNRSRELFYHIYKEMADGWMLFFNGDDNYELVANKEQVFLDDLYNNFLKGLI